MTILRDQGRSRNKEKESFSDKYIESDLIRDLDYKIAEEEETFFAEKYLASDLIPELENQEPRIEFKFKFDSDTGVFSANTDIQLRPREPEARPVPPPRNNGFKIYTLPTK